MWRKLFLSVLCLSTLPLLGQLASQYYTPNSHLGRPPHGYPNYDMVVNQNMTLLDSILAGSATNPWSFRSHSTFHWSKDDGTELMSLDQNGHAAINSLTIALAPQNPTDGVNKQYIDAVLQGLAIGSSTPLTVNTVLALFTTGGSYLRTDGTSGDPIPTKTQITNLGTLDNDLNGHLPISKLTQDHPEFNGAWRMDQSNTGVDTQGCVANVNGICYGVANGHPIVIYHDGTSMRLDLPSGSASAAGSVNALQRANSVHGFDSVNGVTLGDDGSLHAPTMVAEDNAYGSFLARSAAGANGGVPRYLLRHDAGVYAKRTAAFYLDVYGTTHLASVDENYANPSDSMNCANYGPCIFPRGVLGLNSVTPSNFGVSSNDNHPGNLEVMYDLDPDTLWSQSGHGSGVMSGMRLAQFNFGRGYDESQSGDYIRPSMGKLEMNTLELVQQNRKDGQHTLVSKTLDCFATGDCIGEGFYSLTNGGANRNANEGAHLADRQINEYPKTPRGYLSAPYTPGSTSISFGTNYDFQNVGDGLYFGDLTLETTPSTKLQSWAVDGFTDHTVLTYSGTPFTPDTVMFTQTEAKWNSAAGTSAPGAVTFTLLTSGLPSYAVSTAASIPNSGIACLADNRINAGDVYFEQVPYTKTDNTHIAVTAQHIHVGTTMIAVGPNCGTGHHMKADDNTPELMATSRKWVLPIYACISSSTCLVDRSFEPANNVGTSSIRNYHVGITSITRNSSGLVTLTANGLYSNLLAGRAVTITGTLPDLNIVTPPLTLVSSAVSQGVYTFQSSASAESAGPGGSVDFHNGDIGIVPIYYVTSVSHPDGATTVSGETIQPSAKAMNTNDYLELFPSPWMLIGAADQVYESSYIPQINVPIYGPCGVNVGNKAGGIASARQIGCTSTNGMPPEQIEGYNGTHRAPDTAFESIGAWQEILRGQVMQGGYGERYTKFQNTDSYMYPLCFGDYCTSYDWGTNVYNYGEMLVNVNGPAINGTSYLLPAAGTGASGGCVLSGGCFTGRGRYTITPGTGATAGAQYHVFTLMADKSMCTAVQSGGTAYLGISASNESTTGFDITIASVPTGPFTVDVTGCK